MQRFPTPPENTRIGFHYYPDTLHYRESDLAAWLPELRSLGASWITLMAPPDRAIPEGFLRGLIAAGIEPVLHVQLPCDLCEPGAPQAHDLGLLFNVYAHWGVHYVALFDRPNTRAAWSPAAWSQPGLVERFLDYFLPLATTALEAGLFPVFPPLEPGGDFWDLAFLRLALQGIQRRVRAGLLDRLILGAYGWTMGHPLDWGAGGPERWPASRPYQTPPGSQDQRGFCIFDWYFAEARAALGKILPVIIVAGGARVGDQGEQNAHDSQEQALDRHARLNLEMAARMAASAALPKEAFPGRGATASHARESQMDAHGLELAPAEVLACNFWLLSASHHNPEGKDAWYQPDGQVLPAVHVMQGRFASQNKPIEHYLLLPSYEWGVSDWHLDAVRPFLKKYHPAVGFSVEEARCARRVTVVGGPPSFSEDEIHSLRRSGCVVHQIRGDGTDIASELSRM